MQEKPPYPIASIRVLLSQYLDGILDADKVVEVELLLERFPEYQQELLKLQKTRGLLQNSMQSQDEAKPALKFSKVSDMVWQNIARQIESDRENPAAEYDFEFISAYYDGEIPSADPAFSAFEAQLYQNDEANRQLAEVGQLSESIRQFGYRQEEACRMDWTQSVMDTYRAELGMGDDMDSIDPAVEVISAFVDDALAPKDVIEANRLIESREDVRRMVADFNQISDAIQSITTQLQAQAPDCWPAIRKDLQENPVVDLDAARNRRAARLSRLLQISVPTAAAAALILLFSVPTLQNGGEPNETDSAILSSASVKTASKPVAALMTQKMKAAKMPTLQLAAVPMGAMHREWAKPTSSEKLSGEPAVIKAPQRAMVDASRVLAARPPADEAPGRTEVHTSAPSSEEYLFHALNEQMPSEDISNILGQ